MVLKRQRPAADLPTQARDARVSIMRKKQNKRPSPLSQEFEASSSSDDGPSIATIGDVVSDAEMDNDNTEAMDRYQELKVAKTEEEEIERFSRQQARARTKSEATHNEDLHQIRLRMMRKRKAAREAERKAAQAHESAMEPPLNADWTMNKEAYNHIRSEDKEETPGVTETSPLDSTAPLSVRHISDIQRKFELRLITGDQLAPSTAESPDFKRTDSKAVSDSDGKQYPLPSTAWRNPKRQRGTPNVDQSRIETQFILRDEFIDDVNTMLDFINGWPMEQFTDIVYSFTTDRDNRDKKVEFVDRGRQDWTVRLLKPDKHEPNHGPADTYTHDDLPEGCREFGCIKGCPRRVSMQEKINDLKRFREAQKKSRSLNTLSEAPNLTGPSFGVLPYVPDMPPPPSRSDQCEVSHEFPGLEMITVHSSPMLNTLTSAQEPPKTPRMKSRDLPDTDSHADRLRQAEQDNAKLRDQVRQLQMMMIEMRAQLLSSGFTVPERVTEWIQNHNESSSVCNISETMRKDSVLDELEPGSLGGKLVYREKTPTGPNSIRAEALGSTIKLEKQCGIPELMDEKFFRKPREKYYAKRVPPKNSLENDLESEEKPTLSPPKLSKQSPSNSVDLSALTTTEKIRSRPQYECNPEAYWKWQAAKAELMSRERDRRKTENIPTSVPNEGAMTHLIRGFPIETHSLHKQTDRKGLFDMNLVSQFQDFIAAHKVSESSPVFDDSPPPAVTKDHVPLYNVNSLALYDGSSEGPCTSPPSLALQPTRRTERNNDISVWDPDERPVTPAAPLIRDDMELDGDIPVWDPEEELVWNTSSAPHEKPSQVASDAYLQHVRRLMRGLKTRRGALVEPVPAVGNAGNESTYEASGMVGREG